jgi:transcriptional regulator with XRE-family HTH domain
VAIEQTVGQVLLEARLNLNLSQKQVGATPGVDVDQTTISRWERDDSLPGADQLKPLAGRLRLDYVALLELITEQSLSHAVVRTQRLDRFEKLLDRQSKEIDRLNLAVGNLVDAVLRDQQSDESNRRGTPRR